MSAVKGKLQTVLTRLRQDEISSAETRLRRRQRFTELVGRFLPAVRLLFYVIGAIWLLFLPSSLLGRGIYIDENALSPGQADTHWGWAEVHDADNYLRDIEALRDKNASSFERGYYIMGELLKVGIPADLHAYTYNVEPMAIGVNAYGIVHSPRTSGTEAMIISAPWLSHSGKDVVNVRGVSLLLSLAKFLKRRSIWAKDLIFVVPDGSMDGMQAFLSEYHGVHQKRLSSSKLNITSGSIWTAFNIDYPGHSFAQLGIFHEGLNGRLPNQDMMNTFTYVSEWSGARVTMYDTTTDSEPFPKFQRLLPKLLRELPAVQEYLRRARNILRHASYQSLGKPSGIHGLFHQYRIDAFTMYAIPDVGPHGFHTLGRVIEATLRSANNLLERLHASFFFYIQTTPRTFLKVGHYLPAVILVSVATMFGALQLWVDARWVLIWVPNPVPVSDEEEEEVSKDEDDGKPQLPKGEMKWVTRDRPVLDTLIRMAFSHVTGVFLWHLSEWPTRFPAFSVLCLTLILSFAAPAPDRKCIENPSKYPLPSHWKTLKAFTLSTISTLLTLSALLNYSLSVLLAITLLPFLLYARPPASSSPNFDPRVNDGLGLPWWPLVIFALDGVSRAFNTLGMKQLWEVYGVWTQPLFYLVWIPLMLDGVMICSLPLV